MKNKKWTDALFLGLRITVAGAIFLLAILNYKQLTSIDIRALVSGTANIFAATGIVLAVYFVKSILFVIPASLIYISVGMAFKPWQALLINLAGIALEVTTTFLLGKFLGGDAVEKRLSGKKGAEKLLQMKPGGKWSVLFMVRVLPVFPIDFSSLFLGASGFSFLAYFFISLLGIMPRVALFTLLGDGIYDYIPTRLVLIWLIQNVRKKKSMAENEDKTV